MLDAAHAAAVLDPGCRSGSLLNAGIATMVVACSCGMGGVELAVVAVDMPVPLA